MNDRPEVSDDAIRHVLDRRAGRSSTSGVLASVQVAAAGTAQRRTARFGNTWPRWPLAAGIGGMASALLLVIAFGLATGWRISGTATATAGPTGVTPSAAATSLRSAEPSASSSPVSVRVLPLTVDQLNALMVTDSGQLTGLLLVVTGTIVPDVPRPSCIGPLSTSCAGLVLEGSNPLLSIEPAGVGGPEVVRQVPTGTSTFAAIVVSPGMLGYTSKVQVLATGPYSPSLLPDPSPNSVSAEVWMVDGWITGLNAALPCPIPRGGLIAGPQYGCGRAAALSDDGSQTVSGLSLVVPDLGVRVQNGAYDDFSPHPQGAGAAMIPEEATFLLGAVAAPPCAQCRHGPKDDHWQILSRVDPWPVPGVAVPALRTASPEPGSGVLAPVRPLTVAQLNAYMAMNSHSPGERAELVITGTIDANPSPAGVTCTYLGPAWSCPPAYLVGSNPKLGVEPVGDIGPGPWDSSDDRALTGTFLASLDGFNLLFRGPVSTTDAGGPWSPSQLPDPSSSGALLGEWLVQGWISGLGVGEPCPSGLATTAPGLPGYACGGLTSFLADGPEQPVVLSPGGFSVRLPSDGIEVQDGAYPAFAPSVGVTGVQTQPEQATFLLRAIAVPGCATNADCFNAPADYHWEITARIDPWPVPALR